MLQERQPGRPLAEQLEEWKRMARFSDRAADIARCIFERRIPLVAQDISHETGVPPEVVDRVLEAAMNMHTNWPDYRSTTVG